MGRYEQMFARLGSRGEGAFVPFLVIGDPDPDTSLALIRALIAGGADGLELGIPFSDPVADGPTIQSAAVRALAAGVTPEICWDVIARVRRENDGIPIGLLVYANLVVAGGPDAFYSRAEEAGVDSVLVADAPGFEVEPFVRCARRHGLDEVLVAPPDADDGSLQRIAGLTSGYTYVLARGGVTGADEEVHLDHGRLIARLGEHGAPPPLIGFGISRPEHVRAALASGAAGAISGSAVVRLVEEHLGEPAAMVERVENFVHDMKDATMDAHLRHGAAGESGRVSES